MLCGFQLLWLQAALLDTRCSLRLSAFWGLFCGLLRVQMFEKWFVFKVLPEIFELKALLP